VFPEVIFSGSSSDSLPLAGQGDEGSLMQENFSNVELHEKYDEFIFKDRMTSFRFKSKGNPIVFANITGNANAGIITTMIEVLRDFSAFVNESAQGMVYKNFNIRVGTTGFGVQKNIKEAVIRFSVENSWLDNNSLTGLDIRMVKWNGSKWIPQGTDVKEKDVMNTYFEAKTDSFSQFAIVGIKAPGDIMKGGASGVPEARPAETQTPGRPGAPGFEAAAVIAVLFALYILRRR
jgi:PGF-pre-PGF domain-containing protein